MAGVRGFADPNYQINSDGVSVFEQSYQTSIRSLQVVSGHDSSNSQTPLSPWPASYQDSDTNATSQCIVGGYDGWTPSHTSWNNGANNNWVANSPYSMAYFTRNDIPTHFGIAETWTVGDMYQVS